MRNFKMKSHHLIHVISCLSFVSSELLNQNTLCSDPAALDCKGQPEHNSQTASSEKPVTTTESEQDRLTAAGIHLAGHEDTPCSQLPHEVPCRHLPADCISCQFNHSCVYGQQDVVQCRPLSGITCTGGEVFNRSLECRYCYQTSPSKYRCSTCSTTRPGPPQYRANCTMNRTELCLGKRTFHKSLQCKWTKGDRWSTALILSIVLGGFGVDRFYLGHWQEGIGKFFSFGGLGVWTVIDVVLIAIGYLGPADGSLYIS